MLDRHEEKQEDSFELQREKLKHIKQILREAGFPRLNSRFPFAMHHNFYRVKIRICGKKARHKDIRRLLDLWMLNRNCEDDLFWQIICGAVKDLIKTDPGLVVRLPLEVRKGMTSVEDGYAFMRFAKSLEFRLITTNQDS